jgi:hypothetical protein
VNITTKVNGNTPILGIAITPPFLAALVECASPPSRLPVPTLAVIFPRGLIATLINRLYQLLASSASKLVNSGGYTELIKRIAVRFLIQETWIIVGRCESIGWRIAIGLTCLVLNASLNEVRRDASVVRRDEVHVRVVGIFYKEDSSCLYNGRRILVPVL